jgi:hypothetical protein
MADVICPNCGGRHHETTAEYKPGVITTGKMLRLKQFYRENGWDSFPEQEHIQFGDIFCPGCDGLYSDTGRVQIDQDQYLQELSLQDWSAGDDLNNKNIDKMKPERKKR